MWICRLLLRGHFSETPEVSGQQHSHWSESGGEYAYRLEAGQLVESEAPGAKPTQNCGDDSELLEKPLTQSPLNILNTIFWGHLQVPVNNSFSGPEVDLQQRQCLEEGSEDVILPTTDS